MVDDFAWSPETLNAPADDAVVIVPGAAALAKVTRAIYVGGDGDLQVTMAKGGDVTFRAVKAGTLLPIRVTHVLSGVNTTATNLVALW